MSLSLIERDLPTVGLPGRYNATLAAPLDIDDNMQARSERSHRDEARLAVILATIFEYNRTPPVQAFKVAEVDPMSGQVGEPFVLVPGRHEFL
jgi:hypothetical protein